MKLKQTAALSLTILILSSSSFARMRGDDLREEKRKRVVKLEKVHLKGTIFSSENHSKNGTHGLSFKDEKTGKVFDIVDSPEIQNLNCKEGKDLLVSLNAEKTDEFLFWGGNLIVKNFKILKELGKRKHVISESRQPVPSRFREK